MCSSQGVTGKISKFVKRETRGLAQATRNPVLGRALNVNGVLFQHNLQLWTTLFFSLERPPHKTQKRNSNCNRRARFSKTNRQTGWFVRKFPLNFVHAESSARKPTPELIRFFFPLFLSWLFPTFCLRLLRLVLYLTSLTF